MEEVEKTTIKAKRHQYDQIMEVITAPTIREIVKSVNARGIKKEGIVSLLRERDQFVLVYYK